MLGSCARTIKLFYCMPICPCLVKVSQPLDLTSNSLGYPSSMSFQDLSFFTLAAPSLMPILCFIFCSSVEQMSETMCFISAISFISH